MFEWRIYVNGKLRMMEIKSFANYKLRIITSRGYGKQGKAGKSMKIHVANRGTTGWGSYNVTAYEGRRPLLRVMCCQAQIKSSFIRPSAFAATFGINAAFMVQYPYGRLSLGRFQTTALE